MKLKKERLVRNGRNLVQIIRDGDVLAEIPEELIDDVFPVFQEEEERAARNDKAFVETFCSEWERARNELLKYPVDALKRIKIVRKT